ncbi:hypothetical protein SPBR_03367 [Sporothrix brasiliensis 5110]|uniref:Uncharacterized protein n=1 Tax=Sporothrix brasiliensis 5110 TaxID=1398154 RepID=A0A0C2J153_9PEZI|nr:uncharacterized protein SPBR_03367 [Sporothrix brasiliensis 5110]KIH92740.1 hypothetical protein SPBR_03367 [Sporothrix brasiliensis 5110]
MGKWKGARLQAACGEDLLALVLQRTRRAGDAAPTRTVFWCDGASYFIVDNFPVDNHATRTNHDDSHDSETRATQ